MNKQQRFRILNYRKRLLKQEAAMYQKQRKILPILMLCALFTVLFWSVSFWNSKSSQLFKTTFVDNLVEIEVAQAGPIRFVEVLTGKKEMRYNHIEYFVYKNDKRLYHFYCDKHEKSRLISTSFTYHFRTPGTYKIKKRISTKDAENIPSISVLTGFKTPGNTSFITLGKWVFLLALIGFLLLSDYFGKIANYFTIWERKEMVVKTKEFTLVLGIGLFIFSWGLFLSSSNYGHAGYENDMHAPYSNLKETNTYYVN